MSNLRFKTDPEKLSECGVWIYEGSDF